MTPNLQDVLPAATNDALIKGLSKAFASTLKTPKGVNRHLVARGVDYVLKDKLTIPEVQVKMGLVPSEVEYLAKVVGEFNAWNAGLKAIEVAVEKGIEPDPQVIDEVVKQARETGTPTLFTPLPEFDQ